MNGLTENEKRLVRAISRGLPISENPYKAAAAAVGMTEAEVISAIEKWLENGVVRRLTGIVNHKRSGYGANAMVVWDVPSDRLEQIGESFAGRPEVTHCYQRPTTAGWPYGLYTMVHAHDEEGLRSTIEAMADDAGIDRYKVLKTVDEYKKEPVLYFEKWENDG